MFNSPDEGIALFIRPSQSNVIFELLRPLRTGALVWKLGSAAQLYPAQAGWMLSQGLLNLVSESGVGHFLQNSSIKEHRIQYHSIL